MPKRYTTYRPMNAIMICFDCFTTAVTIEYVSQIGNKLHCAYFACAIQTPHQYKFTMPKILCTNIHARADAYCIVDTLTHKINIIHSHQSSRFRVSCRTKTNIYQFPMKENGNHTHASVYNVALYMCVTV